MTLERAIFRRGSTTYYWSSRLFPKAIRADVGKLYSFVRTVDDYVDASPPQTERFHKLRALWEYGVATPGFTTELSLQHDVDRQVVVNMLSVAHKYSFEPAWTVAFLDAMHADLTVQSYYIIDDSLRYVQGSAEVIGLMMGRIMNVPLEAYKAAVLQGRAMQWINFIRDIAEDNALGRQYFPQEDLRRFNLPDLQEKTARTQAMDFIDFMQFEIARYHHWQKAAEAGYRFVPRRVRLPLQMAAALYTWTAEAISRDPFIVFEQKVKPGRTQIFKAGLQQLLQHQVK